MSLSFPIWIANSSYSFKFFVIKSLKPIAFNMLAETSPGNVVPILVITGIPTNNASMAEEWAL